MEGKFVSYLRVSTKEQEESGLGIAAQRKAISDYLNGGNWELIKEYVEIESGKRSDNRPILQEALQKCKRTGSTLLIAKFDRLTRNVAFMANLMESGLDFVAVDFPTANRFTIHILVAIAEYEREMISKRTKEALQVLKAKGVKLGSPKGLSEEAQKNGPIISREIRTKKADEYARQIYEVIKDFQDKGMSLNGIARQLTEDRELTPRGKGSQWTASTVRNVLKRVGVCLSMVLITLSLLTGICRSEDIKVYDKDYNHKATIRDGRIYDKEWQGQGYIKDGRLYDSQWNGKGYVKEEKK